MVLPKWRKSGWELFDGAWFAGAAGGAAKGLPGLLAGEFRRGYIW